MHVCTERILLSTLLINFGMFIFLFFFNDTATTEIYTLSLHDALPIWGASYGPGACLGRLGAGGCDSAWGGRVRSEEHTSELQSHSDLVCRLLLEKKKEGSPARYDRHQQRARLDRIMDDPEYVIG